MPETQTKTKNSYELFIFLNPSNLEMDVPSIENKIQNFLKERGGEVKKFDKFAKRELAYPIKKNQFAYAAGIVFEAEPGAVADLQIQFDDLEIDVLRVMLTKFNPVRPVKKPTRKPPFAPETEPAATDKPQKAEKVSKEESDVHEDEKQPVKKEKEPTEETTESKKKDGVTIEDIDKRLDEIMENL